MSNTPPYFKLHATPETPAEEICHCQGIIPIKLVGGIGDNPFSCLNCNLEVLPESLSLDTEQVELTTTWRDVINSIYHLWLDSRDYEDWALQQLVEMNSPVNRRGLDLQAAINPVRRCYYWYFQDQSADDFEPIVNCPNCGRPFQLYRSGIFPQLICDFCSIITCG